ncbi:hypothetical protein NNO_0579 [Hydrogenimonas sp.]|nr:hypothetical protein NNO_0579 [Hydrogenimonas sp.]
MTYFLMALIIIFLAAIILIAKYADSEDMYGEDSGSDRSDD